MRPTTRRLAAATAAVALLACLALPAAGKELLQATLDAPIALGTPPGTEIIVGVTVTVPGDDGAMHPVEGSPIQLVLTGRDGSRTRAAGAADGKPGHYVMRIAIPAGGVRGVEVVMHGTSDLPIRLMADPLTFGGVTARTAQVAPPLAPPMTPFPRASTVAPAAKPAPAAGPAPVSAPAPVALPALVAAAGLVAVALALILRWRGGRDVPGARRLPGA